MFDLEQAIADWRQQMLAAGIKTPVPLDELEIHLREEIERQMKSRLDEQKAFENSVQRIGSAGELKNEFEKTCEKKSNRQRILLFASIAGLLVGFVYVLNADPFMKAGLIAFSIPTVLGCLSYLAATLLACAISSSPRHVYIGRLIFLGVFTVLVENYCMPHYAFSGTLQRWLPIWVKLEGAYYGSFTVPMWLVIALFKRPKTKPTCVKSSEPKGT
jgi:hypothetical protein